MRSRGYIDLSDHPRPWRERRLAWAVKRGLDVALALFLLPWAALVGAVVAVLIAVKLGRPVIFTQERPGRHEKAFRMLKFRTMSGARDPSGALLSDTERLTGLGRFLRMTSLDELPQIVNVLRGEMSFVGPRPLLPRYLPYYTERERLRFRVRPGLAGWAQVHGRNWLGWDERLEMDAWYVENWSLLLDARIVLTALWVVLTRRGLEVVPDAVLRDFDEERRARRHGEVREPEPAGGSAG